MKNFIFLGLFLFCCAPVTASELSDYNSVKCVIHLHTDISSGTRPLESYVKEAEEEGVGALILSDEDWRRWEFGLPPFRRIIKKVVRKKSVMTFGVEKYLELIKELNKKYKGVIVIGGVQTNPFYYWSGNLFNRTLALNNRNKDMLVIGLDNADDYKNMPSIAGRKSRFDAYHGDEFTRPYQDLIDYVVKKKGMVFWSHPEYEENTAMNGIRLVTVPYQWDLVGTRNYTGFGIFWEGYKETGKPKGIWDRVLTEYCQGKRGSPVWAIGELEEEGLGDKELDSVVNVLYVKDLNRQQCLEALKGGRFYTRYKPCDIISLTLEKFTVSDESGSKTATMGEEVIFSGDPVIKINISHEEPADKNICIKLIRNNEIIKEFSDKAQLKIEYKDEGLAGDKKYYYRIDAGNSDGSHLISNPIFFTRS